MHRAVRSSLLKAHEIHPGSKTAHIDGQGLLAGAARCDGEAIYASAEYIVNLDPQECIAGRGESEMCPVPHGIRIDV